MADNNTQPKLMISKDFDELVRNAALFFADCVQEAVAARGRFTVALSGGSTPRGLHRLLAGHTDDPELKARVASIPWNKVEVFFGDERYVPADDPQSNFLMARETLLNEVPVPENQIHPMPTHFENPEDAARSYEETLKQVLQPAEGEFPQLDLILLGMGPDGHTASLFPGTAAVHETKKWVVAHWGQAVQMNRITLTPPVLCNARHVAFLADGEKKAEVLHRVLEGPYVPDELPSQVVRPTHGTLTWFLDEASASKLTRRS